MKRNLYLLSIGVILCSCTESYDQVTGHARIITRNAPVIAPVTVPEETPIATEAVEPVQVVSEQPVSVPELKETSTSVVAQNQPALTDPAPVAEAAPLFAQNQPESAEPEQQTVIIKEEPAAPAAEVKEEVQPAATTQEQPVSVVAQNQPITTEPAPAPAEEKKPEPVIAQPQPATTTPPPAPAQPQISVPAANQDKPVIVTKTQPAPVVTGTPLMVSPTVVKPKSTPVAQQQPRYSSPQAQPKKRSYPVMPGQNRGLRRRDNATY